MEKPKILVLTSSYPSFEGDYSGLFVEELSKRLTSSFNVFVLSPRTLHSQINEIRNGINIIRYKYWFGKKLFADGSIPSNLKRNKWMYIQVLPFMLMQLLYIRNIVKQESIKAIHAHWLIPQGFVAGLYKKIFNRNIRIVATIHGSDFNNYKGFFGKKIIRFVLNQINDLTVVSNALKEEVKELGYDKYIFVYPMGVDTRLFSPNKKDTALKRKYKINGKLILFVGSLVYNKGVSFLIDSMPTILTQNPDTKLMIIGDGNLKGSLIKKCREFGIEQSVIFKGFIDHHELPRYFATADVFILPSFSEGFGLVVAEAISSGALTIASNLKPINDIIIENRTGFYLKNIDSKSIAEKTLEVLKNQDQYKDITIKGREHIVSNFDWEIVGDNYNRLFLNLGEQYG